jgi:hypothetical protein
MWWKHIDNCIGTKVYPANEGFVQISIIYIYNSNRRLEEMLC